MNNKNIKMDELYNLFQKHYNIKNDQKILKTIYKYPSPNAYLSTDLLDLYLGFDEIIKNKLINTNSWFCDAGSGDGRIVALLSVKYKIPTIGIEINNHVHRISNNTIKKFKHLIKDNPTMILKGDFLDDSVYKEAGLEFKDIKTFYNFTFFDKLLATKIKEQSKKGTKLIIWDASKPKKTLQGLKHKKTIKYYQDKNKKIKISPLHIYEK